MADKNLLDEFAKMVWGRRAEGLPVPELDLKREITPQELKNILLNAAYAQIVNPDVVDEFSEIQFRKARSGWLILDYKTVEGRTNAMATSPGDMLFDHGTYVAPEAGMSSEAGSLQRVPSGRGTITLQIINTAADLVRIAVEEGQWPSIHIVSGHPLMNWGIWKAAQDLQLAVSGYLPSKEEEEKYRRIQKNCPSLIIQPVQPSIVTPS